MKFLKWLASGYENSFKFIPTKENEVYFTGGIYGRAIALPTMIHFKEEK